MDTETNLRATENKKNRSRVLVKKGMETIAIKMDEVAVFYTENKIVFVLTKKGQKYLYDKNLAGLEEELDPMKFFRINRQYVVHVDSIKSFRPYDRVKLELKLHLENFPPLIISQQTAPLFKKWIYEA